MDLHGNNKAVKEKEKKPYPEIKWVFEIRELTRESLWRKTRVPGRGQGNTWYLFSFGRGCSDYSPLTSQSSSLPGCHWAESL